MIEEDLKAEIENKAPRASWVVHPQAVAPSASAARRKVDTCGPRS